jgi:adenylyltransferase/sulfurtransferase
MPKVEAAERKIKALNQNVKVDALATSVKLSNAEELLEGVDVIIDGLDSIETRYVVNRTALSLKIPYVYAGAVETYGNISTIIPNETPCLECFFPKAKDEEMPRCAIVGVFPPVVDIVSNIEVAEAVRILLEKEPCLKNRLLFVDIGQLAFNMVDILKNPDCSICGNGEQKAFDIEEKTVSGLCGREGRGVFMINLKTHSLDLARIQSHVKIKDYVITMYTKLGLTFEYSEKVKISLLNGGVVIIQVAPKSGIYNEQTALQLYNRLSDDLDLPGV